MMRSMNNSLTIDDIRHPKDNVCPVCDEPTIVPMKLADGTITYCTTKGCRFVVRVESAGLQVSIGEYEVKSRSNGYDNHQQSAMAFVEVNIETERERMKIVKADNARALAKTPK